MICYVYVLLSRNGNGRPVTYVGWTRDLARRLDEHNGVRRRGAKSTRGRTWTLIYAEKHQSKKSAMTREYALKRNGGFRARLRACPAPSCRRIRPLIGGAREPAATICAAFDSYRVVNRRYHSLPWAFSELAGMCGIAVAVDWPEAKASVSNLIDGIVHRGQVTDAVVEPRANSAMATRRLCIVDAQHGQQPMASFDGRLLISFNGEIYNHQELRRELETQGVPFRSESDTEVLVNALQIWGAQALRRFKGMYAFVVLDTTTGEFLAARDPFGVKPLYLIQSGQSFLFCSEMRPLLKIHPTAEVMLLPPGYFLTRNFCRQFYRLPAPTNLTQGSPEELDRRLAKAVHIRVPPDLPLASLFSGGIDSTLVTHYARQLRPETPGYIIAGRDAPDFRYAKAYADLTKLSLREVPFEAQKPETLSLLEAVVETVEAFEPAIVRPGLYGYLLARKVHQDGFRVALCGEGADELFAGYGPLEHCFGQSHLLGRHVQEQCLSMMHRANLQRLDRTSMRFALEVREPFLDPDVVDYAIGLDAPALLKTVAGFPQGKQPLRALYDLYPQQLPSLIRDRKKVHFDEGAGIGSETSGWRGLFEEAVGDAEFEDGRKQFAGFDLADKEEFFYLRALSRAMDVTRVTHLKSRTRLYVPEGTRSLPEAMTRITPRSVGIGAGIGA
ncbi:MAG: asparagine synthase-related protein [Rhizomicrobium sp.]